MFSQINVFRCGLSFSIVSAAIALGSLTPPIAAAEPDVLRTASANRSALELAQAQDSAQSPVLLPDGTIVFSQTDQIAVRVYNSDGLLRLNLYNKQTGKTELLGALATAEATSTGTTYRHGGTSSVEVTVTDSGEQTITVNQMDQQQSAAVTGTVFYRPRIALSPNAVVEVSLADISLADGPAVILASQQIVAGGRQVPFSFALPYDAGQIDPRSAYAVEANITVDGNLQFTNATQILVITDGNPTTVQAQVEPVNQPGTITEEITLQNTAWQLEKIQYNNDRLLEPASSSDYTVEFMDDGQLSIQADCNRAMGSFTEEGSSLSIELGPTTLAACSPESLGQDYLQALQSSAIYFLQDGDLFIDLRADAGTMQFSPMSDR